MMAVPVVATKQAEPMVYPSVSVIVPIYNGEADLPALLECLMEQQYPLAQVEYCLVDNGSSDRTPQILQSAAQFRRKRGIQLYTLTYSAIQSAYAARNAGVAVATGDILVFTDADCQPASDWLVNLVQPFRNAAVGLVAGEIKALPSTNWLERYADRQNTLAQHHTLNHPYRPYAQTANLAVRASIFWQVGLFRPHLTTGGDADLCWRIQQETHWQLVHAADAVVYHRHRHSLKGLRQQWYRYGCSNRYLHELHGVELMRPLSGRELRYRFMRWGLKEFPQATFKLFTGQGTPLELVITPLDLWCARARTQGLQLACLPENAHTIARLGEDI
jgi:glycosyltransferase involved in cell wall biosynthesis